jgi:hypothetical protein
MTFDEWFYQQLNFSLRAEWFHNDAEIAGKLGDTSSLVKWLKAAYDVGYMHRDFELMDDGK